jgi:O-antigen ligase
MPLFRDVPSPPLWPPPRDAEGVQAALRYARERDPIGHTTHTILAMIYLFLLPLTTMPKDAAFIVLVAYTLARVHCTLPATLYLARDRLGQLFVLWAGWHALSLLWSSDVAEDGMVEVRAFRVVLTGLILWPVLDRLGLLILAFLGGVLAQNGFQLLQGLGWLGFEPDFNERLEGLVHPIHAGSVCLAAICWHLSAVIRARGKLQILSAVALLLAGAGLITSGSRGPWLAAAVSLPLMLVVIAWKRPTTRKIVIGLGAAGIVGTAALWFFGGDFVTRRTEEAVADLRASLDGDLDTNLGVRFALWGAALDLAREDPFTGAGAGDFGEGVESLGRDELLGDAFHAHSLYMHELATTGIPGALLATAVVVFAIVRSFRDRPDTAWSLGTPFVLIGWAVATIFDAYHLNGHMFGLFAFALAIITPGRPPVTPTGLPAEPKS